MLVKRLMSEQLFIARTTTPVTEAQDLMRREHIHHLPVVSDSTKKLVGIVSEKDLLYASPSPASTLDVYEMTRLLSKLTCQKVMTKEVVTCSVDTVVEDAARLMVDNDIGCLPVVDEQNYPVGILTESDLFRLFIDLFGTREKGLRATIRVPEQQGEIARLGADIATRGGNIVAFGALPGDRPTNAVCILKVTGLTRDEFMDAISPDVLELIDLRET